MKENLTANHGITALRAAFLPGRTFAVSSQKRMFPFKSQVVLLANGPVIYLIKFFIKSGIKIQFVHKELRISL